MDAFERLLLGEAPALREVCNAARIVAATDVTVLIEGESGTGKELFARALHEHSRRAGAPFVSVNCAALPETLAESLLFGHARGAFTGAVAEHAGHVREADGGTLFLDELAELPMGVQAKLLRFLESGEFQPVGQARPGKADVRVVAATHRELRAEVSAGRFRADLYYRLAVVPLRLPSLRERGADVERLAQAFCEALAERHGVAAPRWSAAALSVLRRYDWPGNVRELRNLCERMVILCPGRTLGAENLPAELLAGGGVIEDTAAAFALPASGVRLDDLEQGLIRQALERTQGNRSRAARLLGITRDTLLYRLKKFAIDA